MEPKEIVDLIEKKIDKIKNNLPEKGRRLKIKTYLLPSEYFEILMKDEEFAREAKKGNANLGGIPVKKLPKLKNIIVDCFQEEKQYKYFKVE